MGPHHGTRSNRDSSTSGSRKGLGSLFRGSSYRAKEGVNRISRSMTPWTGISPVACARRHKGLTRVGAYHTRDSYIIRLPQPLLNNSIELLSKTLEECDLIADYYHCLNAMQDQPITFTARSTYRVYRRFLAIIYQIFGPFSASISFDEDYPPAGCAYNTTVNIEVDTRGMYFLSLLNVLSLTRESERSTECQRLRVQPAVPFEANAVMTGTVAAWLGGDESQ